MKLAINSGFVLGILGFLLGVTGPSGEMVIASCILFGASTIALAIASK